jgi:hypothetical protein
MEATRDQRDGSHRQQPGNSEKIPWHLGTQHLFLLPAARFEAETQTAQLISFLLSRMQRGYHGRE